MLPFKGTAEPNADDENQLPMIFLLRVIFMKLLWKSPMYMGAWVLLVDDYHLS